MKIIIHWIILSAAVWLTTQIVSGVSVNPVWTALLVLNGLIFWYFGSGVIRGFSVTNFTAAFIGAILVSLINWVLTKLLHFEH